MPKVPCVLFKGRLYLVPQFLRDQRGMMVLDHDPLLQRSPGPSQATGFGPAPKRITHRGSISVSPDICRVAEHASDSGRLRVGLAYAVFAVSNDEFDL